MSIYMMQKFTPIRVAILVGFFGVVCEIGSLTEIHDLIFGSTRNSSGFGEPGSLAKQAPWWGGGWYTLRPESCLIKNHTQRNLLKKRNCWVRRSLAFFGAIIVPNWERFCQVRFYEIIRKITEYSTRTVSPP
jgi:hypothetical protein